MRSRKTLVAAAACVALSCATGNGFAKGDDRNLERLG